MIFMSTCIFISIAIIILNTTVVSNSHNSNYVKNTYTAGYYNNTNDIDAMQFSFSSGNIDSGIIKLYGIKDS